MSETIHEHKIQSTCFIWHNNTFPEYRGLLFHVNNKAKNAFEGNKMKALGSVSGIPDLIYIFEGKVYGIEMKTENGVLQPQQKMIHKLWENHKIDVFVCRSFDQFKEIILKIHNTNIP